MDILFYLSPLVVNIFVMDVYRRRSLTEALVAGMAFGSASIFIRYLSFYGINSFSIAFFRLIIGSFVLMLFIYFLAGGRVDVKVFDRSLYGEFKVILVMAIALSLHFIFYIQSVIDTYILNATLIVNTTPIITLIFTVLLGLSSVSIRDVFGVALGFIGAFIMVANGLGGGTFIGDLEAFAAAVLYSIYIISGKFIGVKDIISVMSVVYLFSVPIIFLFSLVLKEVIWVPLNEPTPFLFLLALGVIPTAIGHTLFISSLKGLAPHETSLLGLLEPVSASIYSVFLFGELPPSTSIVGGVIIAISIYIISKK